MKYLTRCFILPAMVLVGCLGGNDDDRAPESLSRRAEECSVNCFRYNEIVFAEVRLAGEAVICSLETNGLPDTLWLNQSGQKADMMEYGWEFYFDTDRDNIDDYKIGFLYLSDGGIPRKAPLIFESLGRTFGIRIGDRAYGESPFLGTHEIIGNSMKFTIRKGASSPEIDQFMRSNVWVETYVNDGNLIEMKTLRLNFKGRYED